VFRVPRHPDKDNDREAIRKAAHQVLAIMQECEGLPSSERRAHALRRLDELEAAPSRGT
jgi:tert-butyl alcohol monooxygenase / tert-amyl alcohol desaturase